MKETETEIETKSKCHDETNRFPAKRFSGNILDKDYHAIFAEFLLCDSKRIKKYLDLHLDDINRNWASGGGTPLHLLVANELQALAQRICTYVFVQEVKKKKEVLDLKARDVEDKTLLLLAVKARQFQFARFLLTHQFLNSKQRLGDILNWKDNQKRTACHYAVLYGELELVSLFISSGSDTSFLSQIQILKNKKIQKKQDKSCCIREELKEILISIEIDPERSVDAKSNAIPSYLPNHRLSFPLQVIAEARTHIQENHVMDKVYNLTFIVNQLEKLLRPPNNHILATAANLKILILYAEKFCEPEVEQFLKTLRYSATSVLTHCVQKHQKNKKYVLKKLKQEEDKIKLVVSNQT